jgi:mannose-1-phosphate guanylyltransferase/mannose-6-phosphate isomerase
MKIIILAGGSGTRLFPLSRKKYPKQFLKINDDKSLFQKTVERSLLVAEPEDLIIITNRDYKFIVKNQLSEISTSLFISGNPPFNIILEPVGKNTAPAIGLTARFALDKLNIKENETLFVFPADHSISPNDKFTEYIKSADELAKEGYIVTFGIEPTKSETGYGYIESESVSVSASDGIENEAFKVKRFREKPNLETAEKYLEENSKLKIQNPKLLKYYWNSGMFAFSIKTIIDEFKSYAPEIFELIDNKSFDEVLGSFDKMPEISIDYAVMEKTGKACVLPLDINWSDVGSWDAFYDVLDKDNDRNVKIGNSINIDTKNSFIFSNKRLISTIDVEDLVIIDTDDVLLVAKKGSSQKVKDLVDTLKNDEDLSELTELHTTVHRPWGAYTELEKDERYKIKRIAVNPGEALSLQMHHHRSEHWVVVKGTAKVVLENKSGNLDEFFVHENESIYVPKTKKHRLINEGKIPLEIIEIQVGEYVGEDDIVRFEDRYERG